MNSEYWSQKTPSCVSYHILRLGFTILFLKTWSDSDDHDERLDPALLVAMLFVLQSAASNAEPIGKATSVKPQAEGIHEGDTQALSNGSEVYSSETVRTGNSGVADLQFHDNSNLSVGPQSTVLLDKFIYDPSKSTGSVVIQATRGSFRFVTASQGKGTYQIKTPFGTLGVRGEESAKVGPFL